MLGSSSAIRMRYGAAAPIAPVSSRWSRGSVAVSLGGGCKGPVKLRESSRRPAAPSWLIKSQRSGMPGGRRAKRRPRDRCPAVSEGLLEVVADQQLVLVWRHAEREGQGAIGERGRWGAGAGAVHGLHLFVDGLLAERVAADVLDRVEGGGAIGRHRVLQRIGLIEGGPVDLRCQVRAAGLVGERQQAGEIGLLIGMHLLGRERVAEGRPGDRNQQ